MAGKALFTEKYVWNETDRVRNKKRRILYGLKCSDQGCEKNVEI